MDKILMTIRIRKIGQFLVVLVTVLLVLSAIASTVHYLKHRPPLDSQPLVRLFRLVDEANIPTFFATVIDLGCAAVLAILAMLKKGRSDRFFRHWAFLSAAFFYIALDETAMIHELLISPLRKALGLRGIFYYSWIIVGLPVAGAIVISFLRFLKSLPSKYQFLFIMAGAIYVGGSMAGEMITGYAMSTQFSHWIYVNAVFSTLEELFEIAGAAFFLWVLLSYLKEQKVSLEVRLT